MALIDWSTKWNLLHTYTYLNYGTMRYYLYNLITKDATYMHS